MRLTAQQARQLAIIISCSFEELRNRSADQAAVAALAYASHNLPFLAVNDHPLADVQQQFERFHHDHGYRIFDFVAMLTTLEQNETPAASFRPK